MKSGNIYLGKFVPIPMKHAVLYLRVSTIDQTTANQEGELQAIAGRMGWEISKVYKDRGGDEQRVGPYLRRPLTHMIYYQVFKLPAANKVLFVGRFLPFAPPTQNQFQVCNTLFE